MVSIAARISLLCICISFMLGFINNYGILPIASDTPTEQNLTKMYLQSINPGDTYQSQASDPFGAQAVKNAVGAFANGIFTVLTVIPLCAKYGVPVMYVALIQGPIYCLYGYDILAYFKGWDLL